MSKKPISSKVVTIIVVALICFVVTVLTAFLFGSINAEVFDFSNLNFSNMLPVIIIGGITTCIIVGLLVVFLAKDVFINIKNYFLEREDGGN